MWDVIFYLCPLLQEHIWGIQQAVGVNGYKLLLFSAVVAAWASVSQLCCMTLPV